MVQNPRRNYIKEKKHNLANSSIRELFKIISVSDAITPATILDTTSIDAAIVLWTLLC